MRTQILKFTLAFIFLFALIGTLWRELFYADPHTLPSALVGQSLPVFALPTLADPTHLLTQKMITTQPIALVNVWASWCEACALEQPMLMKIHEHYGIPIFGIDYKDTPHEAKAWLAEYGNPYVMIGNDDHGDVAIDLGVYGTPETFVVNNSGMILYRQVGVITQNTWDNILLPLLKKYGMTQ